VVLGNRVVRCLLSGALAGFVLLLSSSGCRRERHEPAFDLAMRGEAEELEALLQTGELNLDVRGSGDETLLHVAVRFGHVTIAEMLLRRGLSANVPDRFGDTPLHLAARRGSVELIRLLVDRGADVSARAIDGRTPLMEAASSGNYEAAALLVHAGAPVAAANCNGRTALHCAAIRGAVDMLRLLLSHGAPIDAQMKSGETPLSIAIRFGYTDAALALLERGAALLPSADGTTPLHLAALGSDLELICVLLARGANVNAFDRTGMTPLHKAADEHEQRVEVLSLLLIAGADPEARSRSGRTPFDVVPGGPKKAVWGDLPQKEPCFRAMSRAAQGRASALADMLDSDPKLAHCSEYDLTALHCACMRQQTRCAELLLRAGADANARGPGGLTPLHIACWANDEETVRLLLSHGADASLQDERGQTAADVATSSSIRDVTSSRQKESTDSSGQ